MVHAGKVFYLFKEVYILYEQPLFPLLMLNFYIIVTRIDPNQILRVFIIYKRFHSGSR